MATKKVKDSELPRFPERFVRKHGYHFERFGNGSRRTLLNTFQHLREVLHGDFGEIVEEDLVLNETTTRKYSFLQALTRWLNDAKAKKAWLTAWKDERDLLKMECEGMFLAAMECEMIGGNPTTELQQAAESHHRFVMMDYYIKRIENSVDTTEIINNFLPTALRIGTTRNAPEQAEDADEGD